MNYRHIYHAGNIADLFKHAALLAVLERLHVKPGALAVLDTHAGIGRYDLSAVEARKTGEFERGIGALIAYRAQNPNAAWHPALDRLLNLVATTSVGDGQGVIYPGSPLLARLVQRPQDRLALCELHPEDAALLKRLFLGDASVAVHHRDGYEALKALLPPKEKRGLVLIDPPFERPDEFPTLVDKIAEAHRRWPVGLYLLWYPIKNDASVARFRAALAGSGIRRVLAVEFHTEPRRPDEGEDRFRGSGLILINPPWQIEGDLAAIGADLARALALPSAETRIDWLVGE